MSKLNSTSEKRLVGVDPRLVAVVRRAVEKLPFNVLVVEGLRSLERQKDLYAQGRTKPGRKVTWTMNSNHLKQANGFGAAVDLAPLNGAQIDWNDLKKFDAIAKAMFEAAEELGIRIRWGADWDQDGNPRERGESDSPHFELMV